MSEGKKHELDRRAFVGAMAVAGAGVLMTQCGKKYPKLTFLEGAPNGPPLKAGLIGCGGRGTGAALDFLKAGPNLHIVALADVFKDHLDVCRKTLAEEAQVSIGDDRCYVGFDAYKQLIDSDVDIVLQATPPHFRPAHFDAAVEAKKHVFIEKPVAVDPVGVRTVLGTAEKAKQYGLSVVVGTQRRHWREYIETRSRVLHGAIGKPVAARAYYFMGHIWYRPREKGWSDMEAMIRDWINWCWLSGDHIVEQHIHQIDSMCWFLGKYPVKAIGVGARTRRVTGDQYDFFSVDYVFDDQVHLQSVCRQIEGCKNGVGDLLVGTEGFTDCKGTIWDSNGKLVWKYQEPGMEPGKSKYNPQVQEHVDLVNAIRTNQPYNDAADVAYTTLVAVMGRTSAYTGQEVTWDDMLKSDQRLGPAEYAMGPVPMKPEAPLPGVALKVKGALPPDQVTWD